MANLARFLTGLGLSIDLGNIFETNISLKRAKLVYYFSTPNEISLNVQFPSSLHILERILSAYNFFRVFILRYLFEKRIAQLLPALLFTRYLSGTISNKSEILKNRRAIVIQIKVLPHLDHFFWKLCLFT